MKYTFERSYIIKIRRNNNTLPKMQMLGVHARYKAIFNANLSTLVYMSMQTQEIRIWTTLLLVVLTASNRVQVHAVAPINNLFAHELNSCSNYQLPQQ